MIHSKYSPSKTARDIKCFGAIDFEKYLVTKGKLPKEESTEYTQEGVMLHNQQELIINNKPFSEGLDGEQQNCIAANWNWLLELQTKHGLTWMQTEQHVSLDGYNCFNSGGTSDVISGSKKRTLHTLDWKFGRGVPVYVEKNVQLMTYLLGAAKDEKTLKSYDELWIHLGQPRFDYFESYQCSIDELMGLLNAKKNAQKRHEIVAGEKQCFWCRCKPLCAEYDEMVKGKAVTIFQVNDLMKQNEFDFKLMTKALEMEPFFKKVFKAIRDYCNQLDNKQLENINMKRVAGRSFRRFVSSDQVVKYLMDNYADQIEDIYTDPKLKSPAQLEKSVPGLKKDPGFKELIIKPVGKPTIVSIHDKRPAYEQDAKSAFAHLAR